MISLAPKDDIHILHEILSESIDNEASAAVHTLTKEYLILLPLY
jgi:hypothetical protein